MMRFRIGAVVAALLVAACASGPKVPEGATADDVYAMAEAAREQGDADRAIDLYERVYEDFPTAPMAEEAEWRAAETAFADGQYDKAKEIYQDYHEFHPVSKLGDLGDRMYTIGEKLYAAGESGLLGLGMFPTTSAGTSAMTWITEKLRTHERADDAYMFLAQKQMENRDYEEATANLEALLENYPEREWALEARFLLGEAWLALNRGPAYDLDSLVEARAAFSRYIREVERSEARKAEYADRLETARARIAEVDRRLAEKKLLIADFYMDVERPEAARIYLEDAVENYPDTEAARTAKERLADLPPEKE